MIHVSYIKSPMTVIKYKLLLTKREGRRDFEFVRKGKKKKLEKREEI